MASLRPILLTLTLIVSLTLCSSTSLQVGTSVNNALAYTEEVSLSAIPLRTRTKNVFWSDESGIRVIRGITALDLADSPAQAIVTAGGVGASFVNVRVRSERGDGLNYQVQIFV